MIVKETGSPSEPPLPQLKSKKARKGLGLVWSTIMLLIGFYLVLQEVLSITYMVQRYRTFQLIFSRPVLIPLVVMILLTVYLIARSVQGYAAWLKQRKENAA